jgi:hypothetical protein
MTPETQTGAYQKIRPDHHAPECGVLDHTGGRMGGTDRGEQLNHSTQPTNTPDTHTPSTRHHTNQNLIALTPAEAAQVLAIAMRQTQREDLPILEHLAYLLDRATLPTPPHPATNPTPTQQTNSD